MPMQLITVLNKLDFTQIIMENSQIFGIERPTIDW